MAEPNALLSDRAWLHQRYVLDQTPVTAIAAEAEADPSQVWRWLARHAIGTRGPAGRRSLAGVSNRTVRAVVRRSETLTAAAAELSVDLRTLVARLQAMGDRPHTDPDGRSAEIAEQYAAGASLAELAEAYGVSVRTIRRRVEAGGVSMRSRGRPAST
jgi:transposase-like protein